MFELNQYSKREKYNGKKQTKLFIRRRRSAMLATYSFLPIINAFTKAAGVTVELRDISLQARNRGVS